MKRAPLDHPLFCEPAGALDRYQALLEEDHALREAEYRHPDPRRRRLRVACNDCSLPACCNQRVDVGLVEALVLYRFAARHAPHLLAEAIARGRRLRDGKPLSDVEFFRRRVACPFLVKGRCAVYAVRPHPCRTHYMAGNPSKCRTELAPKETYSMDPDNALLAELQHIADDVTFFNLVDGVAVRELSQLLCLIDESARGGPWSAPRVLDW
jgi:Fe-S-cluster containining protein